MAADVTSGQGAPREQRTLPIVRWYRDHRKAVRAMSSGLIGAAIWEALALSGRWTLTMAPLEAIAWTAIQLWESGRLQQHTLVSFTEFAGGFALAAFVGIVLGLLIATNEALGDCLEPWISALYATPTIALAPLFILGFGIGIPSKIAVVFMLAFFPIVINTISGIRTTEQVYLEAARAFCATRRQIFVKVLLPSALPFIVTGLRLGVGRGLIGVVAGELFGARAGLGFLILTSSQVFDTAGLWLGVFILAGAGILSTVLLQKLERRLAPWRQFSL